MTPPTRRVRRRLLPVLVLLAACATASEPAARPLPAQKAAPAPALAVAPLAGQRVPVLPVTFLTADDDVDSLIPEARVARMAWADTVLADALLMRGPEVSWVLPDELRRAARRAPGTVTDPDRMGHALLRASEIERVPDPLRGYLRGLTAMTDSRLVFVPAAIRFTADTATGGVRAEAALVIADSRNGSVVWRSNPIGAGATPRRALDDAIANILPDFD